MIDEHYRTILTTMAAKSSDLHSRVGTTIQELAVVKYASRDTAAALPGLPQVYEVIRRESPRLRELLGLDRMSMDSIRNQDPERIPRMRRAEIAGIFHDTLGAVADKRDFVSRFDLQTTLSSLVAVEPELLRDLLQEWYMDDHDLKRLVAVETLSDYDDPLALEGLAGEFQRAIEEHPTKRFWTSRSASGVMLEAVRKHGDVARALRGRSLDHSQNFDGFVELLEGCLAPGALTEVERAMVLERLILLRASLLQLPGAHVEAELGSFEPTWPAIACLLALITARAHMDQVIRRLDNARTVAAARVADRVRVSKVRFDTWLEAVDLPQTLARWERSSRSWPRLQTARVLVEALRSGRATPFTEKPDEDGPALDHACAVVFSPEFLAASLQNHPDCRERVYVVIDELDHLAATGMFTFDYKGAPRADEKAIQGTYGGARRPLHDPKYIEAVKSISARLDERLASGDHFRGLELRPGSWDAARRSAGALMRAVDLVVKDGYQVAAAVNRPPGHLATNLICILDNIAIAARYAQRLRPKWRIFVFDVDAHHGLHVQQSFYDDPTVFYCSIHLANVHPGQGFVSQIGRQERLGAPDGIGATLNLPVDVHAARAHAVWNASDAFRQRLHGYVIPALRRCKPDLVLIGNSADAVAGDPFTQFGIDVECLFETGQAVRAATDKPIVVSLEGGYDLQAALPKGFAALLRGLRAEGPPSAPLPTLGHDGGGVTALEVLDRTTVLHVHDLHVVGSVTNVLEADCTAEGLQHIGGGSSYGLGTGSVATEPELAVDSLGELLMAGGACACTVPRRDVIDVVVAPRCLSPFCVYWTAPPELLFRLSVDGSITLLDALTLLHMAFDHPARTFGVVGYVNTQPGGLFEKRLCRSPSVASRGGRSKRGSSGGPLTLEGVAFDEYFQSTGRSDAATALIVGLVSRRSRWERTDKDREAQLLRRTMYRSPLTPDHLPSEIDLHVHFAIRPKLPSFSAATTLSELTGQVAKDLVLDPKEDALVSHMEPGTLLTHALIGLVPLEWT
jgi:acetoin utilization deacetylase AcuC-like enzyme